jgi:hypothetical protein
MEIATAPPSQEKIKELTTLANLDELKRKGELTDSYRYSIVSYCPPQEVDNLIFQACTFYAWIYHDHDLYADGTPKEPHYHYYLEFGTGGKGRQITSVALFFEIGKYTFLAENVRNKKKCLRYFAHLDNPEKARYSIGEIIASDHDELDKILRTKLEDNADFLQDLLNMKPFELAMKYGRDYIKNYKRYEEFKKLINS